MKKNIIMLLGLLLQFGLGFASAADYSKMPASELNNAFVSAVKQNDLKKIQELIQAGADVNSPVSYTWTRGDFDRQIESTVLIYAVRHNCPAIIRALLTVKNKLNQNLNTALNEAIREGCLGVVKELVQGGVDVNYSNANENEDAPLILAVQCARPEAEFSLQAQSKFESRWHQRRQIIQTLLQAGAKVNSFDKRGRTALMLAVMQNDLNTVLDLLNISHMHSGSFFGLGTKPLNYADHDGNTALILAVKHIRESYFDRQGYNICVNSQKIV
jgi:ankyrin repeat protein